MKIAIKKIDINKLDMLEVERKFGITPKYEITYQTNLSYQLSEIIFDFNLAHETNLCEYLKDQCVTPMFL